MPFKGLGLSRKPQFKPMSGPKPDTGDWDDPPMDSDDGTLPDHPDPPQPGDYEEPDPYPADRSAARKRLAELRAKGSAVTDDEIAEMEWLEKVLGEVEA
jgi:hypothetical protein